MNQSNQQQSKNRRYASNNNNNNNNDNILSHNNLTSQPKISKLCLSLTAALIIIFTFTASSMEFISPQNVVHQVSAAKVLKQSFEQNRDKTSDDTIIANDFSKQNKTRCAQIALALQVAGNERTDKGSKRMGQTMNAIEWPVGLVREGKFSVIAFFFHICIASLKSLASCDFV